MSKVIVALRNTGLVLLFFFAIVAGANARECDDRRGIWANESESGRWVFYFSDSITQEKWNSFFELWAGGELRVRFRGVFQCSNGIPYCFINIEDTAKFDGADNDGFEDPKFVFDSDVEEIHNEYGDIEYYIFAHLGLKIFFYQSRVLPSENRSPADLFHFTSEDIDKNEVIYVPSYFQYFACRKHDVEPEPAVGDP